MINTQPAKNRAGAAAHHSRTPLAQIIIRTRRFALTEELRDAVLKKIGRVAQYAPRAFRARVHFERDHSRASNTEFRVMVRYELPGNDIVAEHRAPQPLTALDFVSEKIERRLRKLKTARLAGRVRRNLEDARLLRTANL